jgi:hypothetical protein
MRPTGLEHPPLDLYRRREIPGREASRAHQKLNISHTTLFIKLDKAPLPCFHESSELDTLFTASYFLHRNKNKYDSLDTCLLLFNKRDGVLTVDFLFQVSIHLDGGVFSMQTPSI